jgi:hypothetical protein
LLVEVGIRTKPGFERLSTFKALKIENDH